MTKCPRQPERLSGALFCLFILKVCLAPLGELCEHRQQHFPLFGEGIFHMRGDLVELFTMDYAHLFQVAERVC